MVKIFCLCQINQISVNVGPKYLRILAYSCGELVFVNLLILAYTLRYTNVHATRHICENARTATKKIILIPGVKIFESIRKYQRI